MDFDSLKEKNYSVQRDYHDLLSKNKAIAKEIAQEKKVEEERIAKY